ncbi:hypothetical protein GCM10023084_43580 [Streptomyces lacrimifluminis]|uniref:Uncharacterized protein n=1 Tax=Streptomyces lacrimifluminis TaxID=1500077 RepID=A0A917NMV5_9ACTN|nr:DUF5825 family protein [Streptomyces lacrimifluminis]GGJ12614.1 hypothetical protein GCM10012282_06170 [Streptomyces lacrimifluminis]
MRDDLLTPPAPPALAPATGEHVHGLYRSGVRYTALDEPVSLKHPTPRDLRALDFVRVATARGLLVRWRLEAGRRADPALTARDLSHLQPPVSLDGPRSAERLAQWRERFYVGRCIWRRGPGFVQIRDRRDGALGLFDLAEPAYIQAVHLLEEQRTDGIGPDVLAALRAERLVLDFGGHDWWAPCLIDRWPAPSMVA